jgi:glycerol-3-phosphate dehydrogenase
MRPRDLDTLSATTFDLLVVGGGIHGLAIAYDAASRGLRTALVDASDFGSGASSNHQRTVHGGLRSLQYGRFRYARQSIRERRALARIAPWMLRPLPFLVGTYRSMTRSRVALRAAFKLDEWLARDRNAGIEPELHLPAPRLVSKALTLRLFPGVRSDKLTGGAQWYDYQMVEADRLTFAFAAAADRAGAHLANYVEAIAPLRDGSRISGMQARDTLTGRELSIKAAATVNAAGPRAGAIMATFGVKREYPLLKAMSLLTSKPASDMALAAPASHGRMLTLVPWRGRALVGTSQSQGFAQPDDTGVSAAEVDTLIADANVAFPALKLSTADVTLVHRGLVPAVKGRSGAPELRMIPDVCDHAKEGAEGAFTIFSAKYSSARGVAERVTSAVARRLGKRVRSSRTAMTILPGAGIADHEALSIETARALGLELSIATIRHLIGRYAERAADVIRLMHELPDRRSPIAASTPTLGVEVVYVIRNEMAVRLTDILLRRTSVGALGHPGDEAVHECARIAATELGWDATRTAEEVSALNLFYAIKPTLLLTSDS